MTDHLSSRNDQGQPRLLDVSRRGNARVDRFPPDAARRLVMAALEKMSSDTLVINERLPGAAPWSRRFGPSISGVAGDKPLEGDLTIVDARAWTALVVEGSIGLGRGFIEGWWFSDDPTTIVRIISRNLGPLDDLRNRARNLYGPVTNQLRRLMPRRGRRRNRDDIASHYDLGNEFFASFLDETMTYSSAVFERPGMSLFDASLAKYDRLLAKLGVEAGHKLLEIGTGWGGMAIRAASQTGCSIATTTISAAQLAEAKQRVRTAGLDDRVQLLDHDWRDLSGSFDRMVSVEMIEAVNWRDYDRFFATIERCLQPDGLVGLQAICVPDKRFERVKNTEDFIRRFVFPGGQLPSIGAISSSLARATNLQIIDVEDLSAHYAETLRRWRRRFEENVASDPGKMNQLGLDDRFCRLWHFYLAYCEAGFTERACTLNQIIIAGPDWRPDGLTPSRTVNLRPSHPYVSGAP